MELCEMMLRHEMNRGDSYEESNVVVMIQNDEGEDCVDIATCLSMEPERKSAWTLFLRELNRKKEMEQKVVADREGARRRTNDA